MGGLRTFLWAVPLLAALPAPAAATELCAAVQRLVDASRETPPFASVQRARDNGAAIVPGFLPTHCRVAPATGIVCSYASFSRTAFADWPDPGDCPGVRRAEPVAGPRTDRGYDWQRTYLASGLRIEYGLRCSGCAGGTEARFTASLEGQRRPAE